LDYYYWNNKVGIGTIFGISKESHLVKRFLHVKTEKRLKSGKRAKRKSKRKRVEEGKSLKLKDLPD
jgi:hypothetical protein